MEIYDLSKQTGSRELEACQLHQHNLKDLIRAKYDSPFIHVRRTNLFATLIQCAREHDVGLYGNENIHTVEVNEDAVSVHSDSSSYRGDYLVGADGADSFVRETLEIEHEPQYSGSIAYRTVIPFRAIEHTQIGSRLISKSATQLWLGNGAHVVIYPLHFDSVLNCVFVIDSADEKAESWRTPGSKAEVMQRFGSANANVVELIDSIPDEKLWVWGLMHHKLRSPRSAIKRCVLVGDALHVSLPFVAQGASLAIRDACRLKLRPESVSQTDGKMHSFPSLQFDSYTKRVLALSKLNHLIYHLDRPYAQIRNWFLCVGTEIFLRQICSE